MIRPVLLAFLLLPSTALAQQIVCSDAYTHQEWKRDLDAAEAAISAFDLDGARAALKKSHQALQCLEGIAKPSYVARLARDLSIVFFLQQDEAATVRWASASERAWPGMPWPSDMPEGHPMREQLAEAEVPSVITDTEHGLLIPEKGGGVFVNGRYATALEAAVEVPMFVQVANARGGVADQYWQDGTAWPDKVLGPPVAKAPPAPRWFVPEDPGSVTFRTSPLFGDTAVAAAPEPEPEVEPEPDSGVTMLVDVPGGYIDPFEDAKLRAIRHEEYERQGIDRRTGATVTVRTEVTTYAIDREPAHAVTYAEFAEFLHYAPDFVQKKAIAAGQADKKYLDDWSKGAPPAGKADAPVVWVSFNAAKAYCDLWGGGLAPSTTLMPMPVVDEWRQDGATPVVLQVTGDVTPVEKLAETSGTRGFRCVK